LAKNSRRLLKRQLEHKSFALDPLKTRIPKKLYETMTEDMIFTVNALLYDHALIFKTEELTLEEILEYIMPW
jgi:hypothetical protein